MAPVGAETQARQLLGKPPVPFRKSVNTITPDGRHVAVNAQQYVVLAWDVDTGASARWESHCSYFIMLRLGRSQLKHCLSNANKAGPRRCP